MRAAVYPSLLQRPVCRGLTNIHRTGQMSFIKPGTVTGIDDDEIAAFVNLFFQIFAGNTRYFGIGIAFFNEGLVQGVSGCF